MRIILATITEKKRVSRPMGALVEDYLGRLKRYIDADFLMMASQERLLEVARPEGAKNAARLLLADSRGTAFPSNEFARLLGKAQDGGVRTCFLAVGPANGWAPATLAAADTLFSFGPITLPHELAAVVLAEQVYRAFTILAGHPYHCGH